jgi:hypothetical protein
VRSSVFAGQVMPHRFVKQVRIHVHGEDVVGQFDLAYFLAFEIFHVHNGHRRLSLYQVRVASTNPETQLT